MSTTQISALLKTTFPDMTPASEAPVITSDAQFSEEWGQKYSAVKFEGRDRSFWQVQNPNLIKYQCERGWIPVRRKPPLPLQVADVKPKRSSGEELLFVG